MLATPMLPELPGNRGTGKSSPASITPLVWK
jgi:hypothetical protein